MASDDPGPGPDNTNHGGGLARLTPGQWTLAFGILAYGLAAGAIWVLQVEAKFDTAVTYVGIPTLLAFLLATTPRARTKTGAIMKGLTIALVLVSISVGPGVLCVLISVPLVYLIGFFIGRILDARSVVRDRRLRASVVGLVFLLLAMEGLVPATGGDTTESVHISRFVSMSADEFQRRVARSPSLAPPLPGPLRMGFPVPTQTGGSGLAIGDRRSVYLEDRNIYLTLLGKSGRISGEVVFEVSATEFRDHIPGLPNYRRPEGKVRFRLVSDQSHVAKWLTWKETEISWVEVMPGKPHVRMTVTYDRRLSPGWYFGPIMSFVVRHMAEYILDIVSAADG